MCLCKFAQLDASMDVSIRIRMEDFDACEVMLRTL